MYCYECEEFFDEPKGRRDLIGEYCGQPAFETYAVCPECGMDNIVDAEPCVICREHPAEPKTCYCENCTQKAKDMLAVAIRPFLNIGAAEGDALDLMLQVIE